MKFPRNVRILTSQLDLASFAALFFLLLIFVLIGPLVYTSGLPIQLPLAGELPGTDAPSVHVAVDAEGRLFLQNQQVNEAELSRYLRNAAQQAALQSDSTGGVTLVIHGDKSMTNERLVHLAMLAREAGVRFGLLATLPRVVEKTADTSLPR